MEGHGRVYARIDLDAVLHNLKSMKDRLKEGAKIIAVIKADGYGHGAVRIARMAEKLEYIWGFAVATVQEGEELRREGIRKPILILGYVFPEEYKAVVKGFMSQTVFKLQMAKELNEEAGRVGVTVPVHIAVDTGMTRIGYRVSEESADEVSQISRLSHIRIEGLFTHFAKADEADKTFTQAQFSRFERFVRMLMDRGIEVPLKHVSNSASIIDLPQFQLNAVRAGIAIYGIYPSNEVNHISLPLKRAMSLISHIIYIQSVPEGTAVSYGGTFVTRRPSRIATVSIGYADGYPRQLSNKADVLIRGRRAPVVGRVCMDQLMVDVTDVEAKEMDAVTLVGRDGEQEITVDELSLLSGRFPYEFTCEINKRVPRIFTSLNQDARAMSGLENSVGGIDSAGNPDGAYS